MSVVPDLPWTAADPGGGAGVVLVTRLRLRRLRDVPAFLRTSLAIRRQVMRSPGARSLQLRAQPLARTFTTVSWWDDDAAVRAFARAEPHRGAMRAWRERLTGFDNVTLPGAAGVVPTVGSAAPQALGAA
ncbi:MULTISPECIES: antibiotic biosynthesis monooxygenase family protein [unclassified Blastococcus]